MYLCLLFVESSSVNAVYAIWANNLLANSQLKHTVFVCCISLYLHVTHINIFLKVWHPPTVHPGHTALFTAPKKAENGSLFLFSDIYSYSTTSQGKTQPGEFLFPGNAPSGRRSHK